jgi:hypothetical protein
MIAIFLFYNKALGKQTKWIINKEFVHCHVMINNGDGFILFELTSNGIDCHVVPAKKPMTIIRNVKRMDSLVASICIWRSKSPKMHWRPLMIRSCNEFSRLIAGVDIGFTYEPLHLYNKLLKYHNQTNYEVLDAWRR